jgi:hypothetical protein
MHIYSLTPLGQNAASQTTSDPSPAMRALYFIRRNKNTATDDQIASYAGVDDVGKVMSYLCSRKLVVKVS